MYCLYLDDDPDKGVTKPPITHVEEEVICGENEVKVVNAQFQVSCHFCQSCQDYQQWVIERNNRNNAQTASKDDQNDTAYVEETCGENEVMNPKNECVPKVQNSKNQSPFDLSVFGK